MYDNLNVSPEKLARAARRTQSYRDQAEREFYPRAGRPKPRARRQGTRSGVLANVLREGGL